MTRVLSLVVVMVAACALVSGRLLHAKQGDDGYLERVQRECKGGKSPLGCLKYRAMDLVQRVVNDPMSEAQIWGPISIVKTAAPSSADAEPTTPELQPRAAESELEQMYRFADRQLDRYASTHSLAWTMDGDDDDLPATGRAGDGLGERSKKKKGLKILLPLLLLVKIKLIAIVTLALVVGIKKLMLVAMLLGPLLLTKLKLASIAHQPEAVVYGSPPHHEHHHSSSVEYGGGGAGAEGYGSYPYGGWGSYRRQGPTTYGSQEAKP